MNRRDAVRTLLSAAGVTALAGCQGLSLPPPRGVYGGDRNPLSLAVHEAFLTDAETNTLLIDVFSNDEGIVILKGRVESSAEFEAAERVANRVQGVNRVDNALFVTKL